MAECDNAKLSDAIIKLVGQCEKFAKTAVACVDGYYGPALMDDRKVFLGAVELVKQALASPPRNCDRFGGYIDKLREACARERGLNPEEDFNGVFQDWLLTTATAKEGGANG